MTTPTNDDTGRLEALTVQRDRLRAELDRMAAVDRSDAPGPGVTGGAGVHSAQARRWGAQLDRSIDRAVRRCELLAELDLLEARIRGVLEAPARARARAGRAEVARVRFASIRAGDRIDVGGNGLLTVSKVNRVSVRAGACSWTAAEVLRVVPAPR